MEEVSISSLMAPTIRACSKMIRLKLMELIIPNLWFIRVSSPIISLKGKVKKEDPAMSSKELFLKDIELKEFLNGSNKTRSMYTKVLSMLTISLKIKRVSLPNQLESTKVHSKMDINMVKDSTHTKVISNTEETTIRMSGKEKEQ